MMLASHFSVLCFSSPDAFRITMSVMSDNKYPAESIQTFPRLRCEAFREAAEFLHS